MKTLLRAFAIALALPVLGLQAADTWPSRPITIVAPGSAGGTSDIFARLLANGLAKELGNPVIVENRGGAGTLLGSQVVARSKPDGHTLLIGAAALAISPHVYQNIPFDPVRDLQPVRLMARFPNVVVVSAANPVKNMRELTDLVLANPGRYNYASGGTGISEHLAGELFQSMTGTTLVHVPYKSSAEAVTAVITGDALLGFANMAVALPQITAGKLRAIAVTSSFRSSSLPDVPTVAESGVEGYDVTTWFGLLAPAATPVAVTRTLEQATLRLLSTPEWKERLLLLGAEPADEGPRAFADRLRNESIKWGAVVRKAGIRAD